MAIVYGANVINMSFGDPFESILLRIFLDLVLLPAVFSLLHQEMKIPEHLISHQIMMLSFRLVHQIRKAYVLQ